MYNLIFFKNVLRLLQEQSMTKHDLAEKAGISTSFMFEVANGKANPSIKTMERIADALNVQLLNLLEPSGLDKKTLGALHGWDASKGLPDGFVHMAAILTEYQAYNVQQWNDANRQLIAKKKAQFLGARSAPHDRCGRACQCALCEGVRDR